MYGWTIPVLLHASYVQNELHLLETYQMTTYYDYSYDCSRGSKVLSISHVGLNGISRTAHPACLQWRWTVVSTRHAGGTSGANSIRSWRDTHAICDLTDTSFWLITHLFHLQWHYIIPLLVCWIHNNGPSTRHDRWQRCWPSYMPRYPLYCSQPRTHSHSGPRWIS